MLNPCQIAKPMFGGGHIKHPEWCPFQRSTVYRGSELIWLLYIETVLLPILANCISLSRLGGAITQYDSLVRILNHWHEIAVTPEISFFISQWPFRDLTPKSRASAATAISAASGATNVAIRAHCHCAAGPGALAIGESGRRAHGHHAV